MKIADKSVQNILAFKRFREFIFKAGINRLAMGIIQTSANAWGALVAKRGGGGERKGIFCLHLNPLSVQNVCNFMKNLSYVNKSCL